MKKILFTILFFTTFLTAVVVNAQTPSDFQKQTDAFAGTQGAGFGAPRDPRIVVAYSIQILLMLVGILFLAYTIYGGYLILMAKGEEESVTKGKETIRTAIIGILIVLLSYSITLLAARVASGGNSSNDQFFKPGTTNIDGVNIEVQEDYSNFIKKDPLQ